MARRKVKVYELPQDGITYWGGRYKAGVEAGAEKYKAMIPVMTSNYTNWINFVYKDLVELAQRIANIPKTDDPAVNYSRRGAPFARLFKSKGAQYKVHKIARAAGVTVPTPTPTPPPKITELATVVS
jgi:hypothetical protein